MSTAKINAVLLIPFDITAGMIAAGTTVPAVDTEMGEIAYSGSTAYAIGAQVNHAGSIWEAQAASTGVTPGTDPRKWLRIGPSNRMAALDSELSTITRRPGDITYVLRPGFFSGIGLWGMLGERLTIRIYDQPGGELVEEYTTDLWEQAAGLYELLFMPLKRRTQHYMDNLPLYPDPEVHISIKAAGGAMCEVALISIGHWDTLIGSGEWGGTEYEAEAEVKGYSYLKRNEDGSVTRKRRGSANNVNCTVVLAMDEANHALDLLHRVQGRPVAFIASGLPRYEFLNGFGDVSGVIAAHAYGVARMRLRIEGAVQGVRN